MHNPALKIWQLLNLLPPHAITTSPLHTTTCPPPHPLLLKSTEIQPLTIPQSTRVKTCFLELYKHLTSPGIYVHFLQENKKRNITPLYKLHLKIILCVNYTMNSCSFRLHPSIKIDAFVRQLTLPQ